MRLHLHAQVEVTRRPAVRAVAALAREPDALRVAHPRRHLHGEPARLSVLVTDLELLLDALVRLRERDLDLVLDVMAGRGAPRATPGRPTTEEDLRGERQGYT